MIILGPLFPEEREQEIISASKRGVSNAANNFQWNLIKGIHANTDEPLIVINALPVGTWPKNFKIFHLKDTDWSCGNIVGHEVGCWNIPLVKQFIRMRKVRAWLKKYPCESELLIFTAYLPFLWAVNKLKPEYRVTVVITDIPEFYDMHQVSAFRRLLRRIHCKIVYHFMARVDRFILLTKQMAVPLHVGNRPYLVMEGMCGDVADEPPVSKPQPFSVLYTGRLNRRYGLELLLQAMKELHDPDIELWLCGSGEMEEEICAYAAQDPRIRFFGFLTHEEAVQLQKQATVLVNPRTNQGEYTKYSFPSKTMEYMSTGTPVLMAKLPCLPPEYLPHLYLFQDETPEGIAQALRQTLALDDETLFQKGMQAREFVLKQRNNVIQAKKVLDMLEGEKKK